MLLQSIVAEFEVELTRETDCVLSRPASLREASQGSFSFFSEDRYLAELKTTCASAVILKKSAVPHLPEGVIGVIASQPEALFATIVEKYFVKALPKKGVEVTAVIHPTAKIDPDVYIGPQCVIGADVHIQAGSVLLSKVTVMEGVSIGKSCVIYPQVVICSQSHIGNSVILHPGVVIGSDGFGLVRTETGWKKMPQVGGVRLADKVEIGANTTVDRGALEDTYIAEGVKIDNQVQIAHNVQIGEHTVIAGCTGIAGSTKIGKNCMIAGGAGISGHLNIVDEVVITGMAMVTSSIKAPGIYSSGTGLQKNYKWLRSVVHFRNLSKLVKKVKQLEELLHAKNTRH